MIFVLYFLFNHKVLITGNSYFNKRICLYEQNYILVCREVFSLSAFKISKKSERDIKSKLNQKKGVLGKSLFEFKVFYLSIKPIRKKIKKTVFMQNIMSKNLNWVFANSIIFI